MDDDAPERPSDDRRRFAVAARMLVGFTGSGWAVAAVGLLVAAWVMAGVAFGSTRAWELVMTAGVPVLTLVLLVVVQHTQNHDNLAMQLKLYELIRALEGSQDAMIRVEDASAQYLERLERAFKDHVAANGGRSSAP